VKFLCEHCKAKYQIADEKVAGRTVRMKCRKCGNSIEVRAAVTETPSGHLLIGTLFSQNTCAPLSYETVSYVFLWHGIAIEAVSSLSVCTEEYMISSGGLPDPRTYFVAQLVRP